jgi:L-tartrate/succinate antiporter
MKIWLRKLAPLFVGIAVSFVPHPDGLPQHAWYFFAIFISAIYAVQHGPERWNNFPDHS